MLQDPAGRPRVKVSLLQDGTAGLSFADSGGHPRAVFALLAAYDVAPSLLELEITETTLMRDIDHRHGVVHRCLRDLELARRGGRCLRMQGARRRLDGGCGTLVREHGRRGTKPGEGLALVR